MQVLDSGCKGCVKFAPIDVLHGEMIWCHLDYDNLLSSDGIWSLVARILGKDFDDIDCRSGLTTLA